jgi:hypothetical protein
MRKFLKGAAIALALAGTVLATAGTASADGRYYNSNCNYRHGYNDRHNYGCGRAKSNITIGFRNGGHRGHNRDYRNPNQDNHDRNHNRDSNDGRQGY